MNWCTLYDRTYAPLGIALTASLLRHAEQLDLCILCLDELTRLATLRALTALGLEIDAGAEAGVAHSDQARVELVPLATLEMLSPLGLPRARAERTWKHYCWTLASSLLDWRLSSRGDPECCYLDADCFLFADPRAALAEITVEHSAAAVPHRFPAATAWTARERGRYNVSAVWARGDQAGRAAVRVWSRRAAARCDDSTCGDQLYLDDWRDELGGRLHEWRHLGWGAAPWQTQLAVASDGCGPAICDPISGATWPLLMWHFHELAVGERRRASCTLGGQYYGLSNYALDAARWNEVYLPYVARVSEATRLGGL